MDWGRTKSGLLVPRSKQRGMFAMGSAFFGAGASGPSDPYWANVTSLLPCTGAAGTTTFADKKGFSWAAYGDAKISAGQTLFGQNMAYLDGSGDWLIAGASGVLNFYGQPFTWEAYIQTSATGNNCLASARTSTSSGWELFARAGATLDIALWDSGGGYHDVNSTSTLPSGVLTHISIGYDSGTYYLSVGGTVNTVTGVPVPVTNSGFNGVLGSDQSGPAHYEFTGYIGQVRTTLGVCRYTTSFTPPAAPFPSH